MAHRRPPCIHRWVLSEPQLRTVRGVCRRCGASRAFPTALELPGSFGNYAELDRSRLLLPVDAAFLEEHSFA